MPFEVLTQLRRREWMPRLWLGCGIQAWWGLLRQHRFAVGRDHLHTAVVDTAVSFVNSALGAVEHAVYGRRLRRAVVRPDPLFVLGHWRTGTSLLHEVLCLDPRHAGPSLYACLAPHHFLLTERIVPRLLWWCLPEKRPVDQMAMDWSSSFEDEFALCLLGARSPYTSIAFPNSGAMPLNLFDQLGFTPDDAKRWRAALRRFVTKLSGRHPGRTLVLKSPPHMCRIRVLLELFPRARFVHIVRDPYAVFPSTLHLWRTLYRTQGLQTPDGDPSREMVLATFQHLYECFEQDRGAVPPGQLYELRYEDLIGDPVAEVRKLYEHLHLGEFDTVQPRIADYFAARSSYATNRYTLSAAEREVIRKRWQRVIERYDYDDAVSTRRASSAATS